MPIRAKYDPNIGLVNVLGDPGLEVSDGLNVSRNVTFTTSLEKGVSEVSGSLLQLKGKQEGIHFHLGGNQYISNNAWFDGSHPESAFGRWVYDTSSGGAFRWGFVTSRGQFDLEWAKAGDSGQVITGSSNATWGVGMSLTASNGAIALGKQAKNGVSATFDITGSNPIALAVTGSVDIGGGKPDSTLVLPSHDTTGRNAIPNPRAGMLIFNTSTGKLNFYNGTGWEAVTSST